MVAELLHHGLIDDVAFCDRENALFVEELWVILGEFAKEYFILMLDVELFAADHEKKDGIAFDMAEEANAEAFAFAGTLDNARNVGDAERVVVAVFDDAEVGYQGGEWVVGNLGFGRRYHAEKGGLACVGEAHKAYVGQDF